MATNYEKIKSMTVVEIANLLDDHNSYRCLHCSYHYKNKGRQCSLLSECRLGYLEWLQSESEV